MSIKFVTGDVVQLKSDSQLMTVGKTSEGGIIQVDYFDRDNQLRTATFYQNQLIKKGKNNGRN